MSAASMSACSVSACGMSAAAAMTAASAVGGERSCRHRHATERDCGDESDECFMMHVTLLCYCSKQKFAVTLNNKW
jgi:hypothetical protein